MREKGYLAGFLFIAGLLLYLGHDLIRRSILLSWGLTFGGAMVVAILLLAVYRFRLELAESRRELARKEAELSFALKVQQALFPRQLPSVGGLEFSAVCIPASGISGDYYDVLQLPDGRLIFAIADISGKGISAAILMANLQAFLRVVASSGSPPGEVCQRLNLHFHQVTDASRFATIFYGEWHPSSRLLRYVNAGHNPPILAGRSGLKMLKEGGIPLGILPAYDFETGEVPLNPGDLLVLFSDGITEAGAREGKEFGEERLKALIESRDGNSLAEIETGILQAVRDWTKDEVEDDMTLVLIRAMRDVPEMDRGAPTDGAV
jgi:sigma-B regulation protein RsbU (phosphoserine phosphatase)